MANAQPLSYRATREAVNIYYVYHFPIFIFIIQITGLVFVAIVYSLVKIYLKDFEYATGTNPEKTRNLHLVMAPISFVFISGEGILIFRICRNIKTWQVKVVHIFLHLVSAGIGIWSIYAMYVGKNKSSTEKTFYQKEHEKKIYETSYSTIYGVNPNHFNSFHPALGYFAACTVFIQFISGFILMILNVNSFYVDMVSELHGFLGIFSLITTSITTVCGIMTKMNDPAYFTMQDYFNFTDEFKFSFGAVAGCLIFTWGIIYVVINPHFEWVKIGPL